MAHRRFEFEMPAAEAVVFDAFHYHQWRLRWDSLVRDTRVVGGAPCPSVGAVTENAGAGGLRLLSMRTRFVSYDRPHLAAASMIGRAFPFSRWAASMQHKPLGPRSSLLIYTYTFETWPSWLRWLFEPPVRWIFEYQTRRRFARLRDFLAVHADEILRWQDEVTPTYGGNDDRSAA
jgi:hypothetical protein